MYDLDEIPQWFSISRSKLLSEIRSFKKSSTHWSLFVLRELFICLKSRYTEEEWEMRWEARGDRRKRVEFLFTESPHCFSDQVKEEPEPPPWSSHEWQGLTCFLLVPYWRIADTQDIFTQRITFASPEARTWLDYNHCQTEVAKLKLSANSNNNGEEGRIPGMLCKFTLLIFFDFFPSTNFCKMTLIFGVSCL